VAIEGSEGQPEELNNKSRRTLSQFGDRQARLLPNNSHPVKEETVMRKLPFPPLFVKTIFHSNFES
jgi:hypothetical protein